MSTTKPGGTNGAQPLLPPKDKPLSEKTIYQQAEEYVFTKDLQAGSYLDVKDTASSWCLAQVVKLSGDQLRVHYDGWSEKYDEVIF